jgi:Dimethlysulfonioproprionate lyase
MRSTAIRAPYPGPTPSACEAELADLLPALHITRSKSYLVSPPSRDFGENYGYGVICGPEGGPPALIRDPHIAFGLMF